MSSMKIAGLKIVGHRGAKDLAPENTLASVQKALEHGADEIEVDLRVTKDRIVVLHHDASLQLPSGDKVDISQATYAQLIGYKPDLSTLEQAVELISRRVPLQLEVKWGEPTEPVIASIRQFMAQGWSAADFLFGSKKQATLMELHTALPAIPTVVIEPYLSLRAYFRARQLDTKRLSMNHHGLWPGFVKAVHRRGYALYAYPLNDPTKAKRWQSYGLAGVITDRPDMFEKQ